MYEFLVGDPAYYDDDINKLYYKILKSKLEFPSYIGEDAKDLMEVCETAPISYAIEREGEAGLVTRSDSRGVAQNMQSPQSIFVSHTELHCPALRGY